MSTVEPSRLNTYDEVPYPGHAYPQTHPDRIATLARLFGMAAAPPEPCSVLELACGDGGNLIPMALTLPKSKFVGIDLAARPVAAAIERAHALGLENIEFRQADLLAMPLEAQSFDYIIAHGLYSWVPPAVQHRIMEICRDWLAPAGVAYISYNTYPGGHFYDMKREMMLFHTRAITDPSERITQARALLSFLVRSQTKEDAYALSLQEMLEEADKIGTAFTFHDDLAEVNERLYFHQFIQRTTDFGLQFLAEADFFEMQDFVFPAQISSGLRAMCADPILREQYLDFIKGRRFRQTLLCHDSQRLERNIDPGRVRSFYVSSISRPLSPAPDLSAGVTAEFRGPRGALLTTENPLAKAAMVYLAEIWPRAVSFHDLLCAARERSSMFAATDAEVKAQEREMAEIIFQTFSAGLVELHTSPPPVAQVSERPRSSPLARLQVLQGNRLTSLRHNPVVVESEFLRHVLQLLDGTRDHKQLTAELVDNAGTGLEASTASDAVRDALTHLAWLGLLMA